MAAEQFTEITIPSRRSHAKQVGDQIVDEAQARGYSDDNVFAVRLSLEEALANAIRHGNQENRHKKVRISYRVTEERLDVTIADEGEGFDVNVVPDPTLPENLERPSGRGIMLMRAYMNSVEYNEAGNVVRLTKFNRESL